MPIKARLAVVHYEDVIVPTSSFEEANTQLWERDYGEHSLEQVISMEQTEETELPPVSAAYRVTVRGNDSLGDTAQVSYWAECASPVEAAFRAGGAHSVLPWHHITSVTVEAVHEEAGK